MKIRRNHVVAVVWMSSLILAVLVTVWVCFWHEPEPYYAPKMDWIPDYDLKQPLWSDETLEVLCTPIKPVTRYHFLRGRRDCPYIWVEWGATKGGIREICQYVYAAHKLKTGRKTFACSFTYDRKYRYSVAFFHCLDGKINLTFHDFTINRLKTGELDPGQLLILDPEPPQRSLRTIYEAIYEGPNSTGWEGWLESQCVEVKRPDVRFEVIRWKFHAPVSVFCPGVVLDVWVETKATQDEVREVLEYVYQTTIATPPYAPYQDKFSIHATYDRQGTYNIASLWKAPKTTIAFRWQEYVVKSVKSGRYPIGETMK